MVSWSAVVEGTQVSVRQGSQTALSGYLYWVKETWRTVGWSTKVKGPVCFAGSPVGLVSVSGRRLCGEGGAGPGSSVVCDTGSSDARSRGERVSWATEEVRENKIDVSVFCTDRNEDFLQHPLTTPSFWTFIVYTNYLYPHHSFRLKVTMYLICSWTLHLFGDMYWHQTGSVWVPHFVEVAPVWSISKRWDLQTFVLYN